MTGSMVSLPQGGAALPLTIGRPAQPGPLLAIVPSIFGVGPDVEAWVARFAAAGALVAVFPPFWRQSTVAVDVERGARVALAQKRAHRHEDTDADLAAVLRWGRAQPACNGRAVALGICFGGRFALRAAAAGELDAAATWHGGGLDALVGLAPQVRVPVAMDFGAADRLVPLEAVARIRSAFAEHPAVTVAVHPGAGHGFSHLGTRVGQPAAAEAAARRLEALLQPLRGDSG